MDFIIDSISAEHDVMRYMSLLGLDGKMILVGVPPAPFPLHASAVVMSRKVRKLYCSKSNVYIFIVAFTFRFLLVR